MAKKAVGYDYDTVAADLDALLRKLFSQTSRSSGVLDGVGRRHQIHRTYGTDRVRNAVLFGTLGPYLVKAADNPEGVDEKVFGDIKAAIRKDRPAFLMEFRAGFSRSRLSVYTGDAVRLSIRQ